MKIGLIGSEGSIGKRWKSIINTDHSLEGHYFDVALNNGPSFYEKLRKKDLDLVLVATPTETHYSVLSSIKETGTNARILCEKPITKNLNDLIEILSWGLDLTMVYQYFYAYGSNGSDLKGHDEDIGTYYNSFHSGSDGLAWDCIQLIALHDFKKKLRLENSSYIWKCTINDCRIERNKIDESYAIFLRQWKEKRYTQSDRMLIHAHLMAAIANKKEVTNEQTGYKSINWDPSEDEQFKITREST